MSAGGCAAIRRLDVAAFIYKFTYKNFDQARGGGGGEGCPVTEQKKTSAYIFTPATPLLAPKTVNFVPNRNPTYMSETPFPNLLSFYHCSQSLYECSGARGYADVKTKFSGFDRFPCSINVRTGASGAPLRAPTLRSARIYIKYISVVFALILA